MKYRFYFFLFLTILPVLSFSQDTLTLMKAIATGLEKNFSILLVKNSARIASNNNTIGNAGFLPVIGIDASLNYAYNTTHQQQFSGTVKDVNNALSTNFSAGAYLDWTLFDGLSMFINKKMLDIFDRQGEINTRMAIENNVTAIILNYYGVVQHGRMIRVLENAVELSLERKKIAEAQFSLGSGSRLTLLQSTVDLNADSTNLLIELAAIRNVKATLNQLMGINPEYSFEVIDTINLAFTYRYDSLLARLQDQNTSVLIARSNKELSVLGLKDARAGRYPRLDFSAGYGYSQSKAQTGFLEYNRNYGPSFGFTATYNIFNGFAVDRAIKNAKVLVNSGEIALRDTLSAIRTGFFQTYNNYMANMSLVRLQLTNQDVARENVDIAFEKYRLGSINDIELRETQKKFIDAQYQLILSQFQAKQAEIELLRISGELFRTLKY